MRTARAAKALKTQPDRIAWQTKRYPPLPSAGDP